MPRTLKSGLVLSLVFFAVLVLINQTLHTDAAPRGLFSLQMAATAEHASLVIASWGESGLFWARLLLWLDLGFVAVYLSTLLILCRYLLLDRPGVRERQIGTFVKVLFATAGASQVVESLLLLSNLHSPSDAIALTATVLSLLKFTCLLVGAAGLVVVRAARRRPLNG
ncbi:hypothetical protein BG841_08395 [Marinobacter sp. X15-166B]|nr:hypothetical protein BG841_08395 [Marinobacter sp. X15-166B]